MDELIEQLLFAIASVGLLATAGVLSALLAKWLLK